MALLEPTALRSVDGANTEIMQGASNQMRINSLSKLACSLAFALSFCAPALADQVSFNYQGQVKVQGNRFNGSGQFKFAIVNTSGTTVLWSNDGGAVQPPATAVTSPVVDGVFSVEIGGPGMATLDGGIFAGNSKPRLRTWFSDGTNPFEQLHPDHKLDDLLLNTVQTGLQDYTIYVNGATGNDASNGLSPATAKKTVAGGFDIVPPRVRCNVTVRIAPGIYNEQVGLASIAVSPGKTLLIAGDDTWTTASAGDPTVKINGGVSAPNFNSPGTLAIHNSARITVRGIHFTGGSSGVFAASSHVRIEQCKATSCFIGFLVMYGSFADFVECVGRNNTEYGYHIGNSASAWIYRSKGTNNGYGGMRVNHHSTVFILQGSEWTDNGAGGINVYSAGELQFNAGAHVLGRNLQYDLSLATQSMCHNSSNYTHVGANGTLGNKVVDYTSYAFN